MSEDFDKIVGGQFDRSVFEGAALEEFTGALAKLFMAFRRQGLGIPESAAMTMAVMKTAGDGVDLEEEDGRGEA